MSYDTGGELARKGVSYNTGEELARKGVSYDTGEEEEFRYRPKRERR